MSNSNYPLTEEEFKSIYSRVPKLTVEVIIKTPSGVVLSLRDLPSWHNQWHIPGGTVFYKEFVEDAVKRIAKSELGVDVSIIKLLGYLEYPSEEKERGFGQSVGLAFLCETSALDFIPDAQSSSIQTFLEIPENTLLEQKEFLQKHWDIIFGKE